MVCRDSNPGRYDGRCRRIHWVVVAAGPLRQCLFMTRQAARESLICFDFFHSKRLKRRGNRDSKSKNYVRRNGVQNLVKHYLCRGQCDQMAKLICSIFGHLQQWKFVQFQLFQINYKILLNFRVMPRPNKKIWLAFANTLTCRCT